MNYEERDTSGRTDVATGGGSYVGQGRAPQLIGADTIMGHDVHNRKDENLGDIKEIMLDMSSGRVFYAVLSSGGFLGMGEKLCAVPWSALTLDEGNKRFVLDVDKTRFEQAPSFEKDKWPDMTDPAWVSRINSYYGTQSYQDSQRM